MVHMDGAKHNWLKPPALRRHGSVQDWEEWEDVMVVTPVEPENSLAEAPTPSGTRERTPPTKSSTSRNSTAKVKRLRSRRRQKAQNAKAGIKLITDMSVFKRNNQPPPPAADTRPPKFVDAAALRALEGEPSSASIGSWNWLRRDGSRSPGRATPEQPQPAPQPELSPEDRPIVIGISLPSDAMSSREISRQASMVDPDELTPVVDAKAAPPLRSVWSPDTPDTTNSFDYRPSGSSLASVMANSLGGDVAPPVPALPANYSKSPRHEFDDPASFTSNRNEDDGSPCTLFEEDGGSARLRPARLGVSPTTPDSATSRSHGWWDHVVTPFLDKKISLLSPVSWRTKAESPREGSSSPRSGFGFAENNAGPAWSSSGSLLPLHAPIVRKPCPRKGQSPPDSLPSEYSSTTSLPRQGQEAVGREAVVRSPDLESEKPPPYSPPKKKTVAPLQFRAVFPTQHPLHAQFPPSPYEASPGLGATMTSQGASQTPIGRGPASPMSGVRLPARPQRAFVCHDYADTTAIRRAHKVERQRRRHEKEDKVARRVGGFWRGRGCVPATGCFGRRGREGRKRRRAWLMVWAGLTCVMILSVVLVVVLTGRHRDASTPQDSIWVNLTSFPPMPTGVLTVVGLDNSVSRSACTEPSTLWSCSLPKEEHKSAEPYKANQPTVAMQIQWEKDSASLHDIRSEPKAPDAKEVWFLGNTTDNVRSEHKAGETTPFSISLSTTVAGLNDGSKLATNQVAGPRSGNSSLQTLLPSPDLEADGTAAAAVMIPKALRQPLRLFDRGLESEHYGFYTHFKRTMFLKSVTILKGTEGGNVPLDEDGGCRKDEADYVVTWAETRVLVQIWTRSLDTNASSLLRASDGGQRPGSMPYPVTLTLDTHGGDPNKKVVWSWPVDKRQKVLANKAELLVNRMGAGGSWINPRGSGDPRLGGFDGGTGGCKCEWVNWVRRVS
ncbi:Glycoprotease family protein [Ophiocordyceps camponoti-floridani]|uniref:Glycoprotease family protein n=1 Tax=Ophiocordyceps camponoti-floridani TaxID=2030778 RepID=A0A8H4VCN4_9HYPO|nr:Glycoprotease family protein [Ophiocordyceps camponoti-floridani]